jgi:hypothetical protein
VVRRTEEDGASQRRRGHAACSTKSCDALIANGGGERKREEEDSFLSLLYVEHSHAIYLRDIGKICLHTKKENFIKFNLSLNNCFMFLDQKVRELKLGSKSVSGGHESE